MAGPSSPDSSISISSLLASCSLGINSRSDADRPLASIQYKDRLYDSASKALEDYIVDYEAASTGRITVRPSTTLPTPTRRARPSVRHTRSLTRSGYVARDPDLLSLTTDDLLGFPPDGSLPFSRASQERKRQKNLKKQLGISPHVMALTSPLTPSSLRGTDVSALDIREHRLRSQELQRRKEKSQRERENDPGLYNNANSLPYRDYPRWLTSHKSELGVSGLSSIPDVRYPLWLGDHRLLGDIHTRRTVHSEGATINIPNYPSGPLDRSQMPRYDQAGDKMVNSSIFIDGVKSSAGTDLDIMRHLHTLGKGRPEPISEQTGGTTHKDLSHSPRTEDVLEAERSWEKVPVSYKCPVHVLCEDEENKGLKALKSNLLEDFLKDSVLQEKTVSTEVQSEIQKVDQEVFPVNKSLQKALHHLSRLKELVGDCDLKKKEEDQPGLQT
ncbi:lung adenoma susceptibility protein 2 isoform 2-T4 [Anomaloglossus baeobatrachus]|uniref:lung adenoma susceptibility protein 2 isoform X2 n=1 Tax=Anomaloglossus baeobatrachus TaxID=238106 RepID=UPI003F50657A